MTQVANQGSFSLESETAIGTLTPIESEKRPLTAMAINGTMPSGARLIDGRYPFDEPLWMMVGTTANAPTTLFAGLLQSAPGPGPVAGPRDHAFIACRAPLTGPKGQAKHPRCRGR